MSKFLFPLAVASLGATGAVADQLSMNDQLHIAQQVNEALRSTYVEPVARPRFTGREAIAVFKWTMGNGSTLLFYPGRYTFDLDTDQETVGGTLCESAKEVLRQEGRLIPRLFRDNDGVELEGSVGVETGSGMGGQLGVSGSIEAIAQFTVDLWVGITSVYEEIAKIDPDVEMEIYSRGFASDTRMAPRNLEAGHYGFTQFPYFPYERTQRISFFYEAAESPYAVPDPYPNEALPNLRGKFFDYEFIEPLAEDCLSFISDHGVMEGWVERADPASGLDWSQRVEVFLFIYPAD